MFPTHTSIDRVGGGLLLCVLALAPSPTWAQPPGNSAEMEAKLIAIMRSEAPPEEKAVTCKKLAVYGSSEAVPVLAPLLLDERLASWARIALEAIPGEESDAALRSAVPKLQGRLLVGTINSIGVRRDTKAVPELAGKLKDQDSAVASAAAVALGRIGGPQAAAVLKGGLASASAASKSAVAEGCIRCAEHFLTDGQAVQAIELYDLVRESDLPKQPILEGIRGAILARKDEGIPLLLEQLHSTDKERFHLGLRVGRELPGAKATEAVASEMRRSPADRQPLLLLALADRGDEKAMPVIFEAARTGDKKMRLTAVEILDRLGKSESVPVLLTVGSENDPQVTQAALVALTRMPGTDLDAKLLEQLGSATGRTRQVLIELAARRQISGAIPVLERDAQEQDPATRSAAIQALGALGGTDQVNALVKLFSSAGTYQQRQELETALSAISGRLGNGCAEALLPLIHNENSSVRKAGLHALASAGGTEALTAVKLAVEDRDQSVQDEAVRTLSTWPNTWPEDDAIAEPLLNLARASKKPNYQALAMRGYLQFLEGDKKLKAADKVGKVNEVLPLMQRPEEKRAAIAVVQSAPSGPALETLAVLAGEPGLTEDACSAIVDVAGKNIPGVSGNARRLALQIPIEKSSNPETKRKAEQALARIR